MMLCRERASVEEGRVEVGRFDERASKGRNEATEVSLFAGLCFVHVVWYTS